MISDDDLITPDFKVIHDTLTLGYDKLKLSVGTSLSAYNDRSDIDSIGDADLPAIIFLSGDYKSQQWRQFENVIEWTIPAKLKVKAEQGLTSAQVMRQIQGDINLQAYRILGLPLDVNGNLQPYSLDMLQLESTGDLQFLIDRGGPRIAEVNISDDAQSITTTADVTFVLEFTLDTNPDPTIFGRALYLSTAGMQGGNVVTTPTKVVLTSD